MWNLNLNRKNNAIEIKFLEPWKKLSEDPLLESELINLDLVYERKLVSFSEKFKKPVDIPVGENIIYTLPYKVGKKPLKCKLTIASRLKGLILAASKKHVLKTGVGGSYIVPMKNNNPTPEKLPWIIEISHNDRAYAKFDPRYKFDIKNGNIKKTPGFYEFTGLFIFLSEVLHKLLLYEIADNSSGEGYSCLYAKEMFEGLRKLTKVEYPRDFDNGILDLRKHDDLGRTDLDNWFTWINDVCLALHQQGKNRKHKQIRDFLEGIAGVNK